MHRNLILSSILMSALGTASAAATITAISASSLVIATPGSVQDAAPGSDVAVIAFAEAQGVLLSEDLFTVGGVIAAGTRVDSHMILLNRDDADDELLVLDFDFSFSRTVLGYIGDPVDLVAGHGFLGAAGTTYGDLHRIEGDDVISVSGSSVSGTLRVIQPGDWFRVLTTAAAVETKVLSASAVPVPFAGGLLAMALGGFALVFRKRS